MKVVLKSGRLVLVPQTEEEALELTAWQEEQAGHVLYLHATSGEGVALVDLGPKADACNEPLQVSSMVRDPAVQLISNFAHTPFALDGRGYASVEGFWQGLKFEKESDRRRVAELWGGRARAAGDEACYGATISYEGATIRVGTWDHWALMQRACEAKFEQNAEAREALLSTNKRPLTHKMRRDSRSIPGVIMTEIWMRIRSELRAEVAAGGEGE
jgi:predicted NAD-dependent protein-ADP-ribosyltransferase YbiA (DUF1768 family)